MTAFAILKGWMTACEIACNPSEGWRITVYLQSFEGLKDCAQSFIAWRIVSAILQVMKDQIRNAPKGWRIALMILRRVERLHAVLQRVKGLFLHQDFFHSDSKGWRITLMILRRVQAFYFKHCEGLKEWVWSSEGWKDCSHFAIIRGVEELHLQSFKRLKDHTQSFSPLRITFMVLQRIEELHVIIRRVERFCATFRGIKWLNLQSFDGLKDYVQHFNPSKDWKFNPSRLRA